MSTAQAIADVTNRLVELLSTTQLTATAKPPDKATGSPLNVFLYHTAVHPGWRNQDLPRPGGAGQPARPLLPLTLYYLVSAVGSDDITDGVRHLNLGTAMLRLHDTPVLKQFPATSGIKNQTDPIRITPQPLSLDEMYKLWSVFQAPYRPSVAYEVGTVLIESDRPAADPLPVARRGEGARGWDSSTQFPAVVSRLRFQTDSRPGFRPGETVTLVGRNLVQLDESRVTFRHPRLADPILLPPTPDKDGVTVTIPDDPAAWPAGVYLVSMQNSVGTGDGRHAYESNAIPAALLPRFTVPAGGLTVVSAGDNRSLTLRGVRPNLRPNQAVQLLIGSVPLPLREMRVGTTTVQAEWAAAAVAFPDKEKEGRFVRLRVDGAESLTFDPDDLNAGFDPGLVAGGLP